MNPLMPATTGGLQDTESRTLQGKNRAIGRENNPLGAEMQ